MKTQLTLFFVALIILLVISNTHGQETGSVDEGWKWIVPLKTQKPEIERVFGESITRDKSAAFQTYVADFGKINIAYETKKTYWKEYECVVDVGTVLHYFISPKRFPLSELKLDLSQFKKDATFSPRELSYFNETEGILVATEIVEMPDKTNVERVIAIEHRPRIKHPCVTK